jgi:hypothetical protein
MNEEKQRGRGRPKKQKLVTLEMALKIIKECFVKKGLPEAEADRLVPQPKTIYNKTCGENPTLKNYGSRKLILLDENEVIEKLCS